MLSSEAALRKDRTNANSDMQHRHFATVAAIIKALPSNADTHMSKEDAERVAEHFANYLRSTNPRFDRARFLAACR